MGANGGASRAHHWYRRRQVSCRIGVGRLCLCRRINCPFYWKIGACRHGDQCSRTHYKPTSGQTLILRHLYQNPPVALAIAEGQDVDDDVADQAQDHFEAFYEEVWEELSKFGEIEEVVTVDNIGNETEPPCTHTLREELHYIRASCPLEAGTFLARMLPINGVQRESRCVFASEFILMFIEWVQEII